MTDEQYEQLVIPGKNDYSILVSSGNNKVFILERLVSLVAMAPTDIVFGSDRQHISTTVIIRITFIFYLSSQIAEQIARSTTELTTKSSSELLEILKRTKNF